MTETEKRIKATLDSIEWPPFVKAQEWKVDVDSTGDNALWVWVIISDSSEIEADASAWSGLRQTIRSALATAGVDLWPYIRVKAESEREESARRPQR